MFLVVHRCIVFAAAALFLAGLGPVRAQDPTPATYSVVHIEILGADAPRLQRFYAELFGWNITLNPVGYGYVPVAPTQPVILTGGIGQSPQGRQRCVSGARTGRGGGRQGDSSEDLHQGGLGLLRDHSRY